MESPQISIIVPVYNMERYLVQCLESIKEQTFTNWECILVDDGSTDSSSSICDAFASTDSRFMVIHKSNGGLSDARNVALRAARGNYIGFIDSDDWIESEMFQLLYELITKYDADIAQIGFRKEYKGRSSTKHLVNTTKVISGEEAIREIGFDRLPNYVWNKLHRKSIITCEFPQGRNFEDIVVYGEWLKNVKRMVLDPTPMYHYRMRKGSIIHSEPAKNRYDHFHSCIDRMHMIENSLKNEKDKEHIYAYINNSAVNAAKNIARNETNKSLRDETIEIIRKEVLSFPLPSYNHMGLKSWWRAKLLINHPRLFGTLMRAVNILDLDIKDRKKRYFD